MIFKCIRRFVIYGGITAFFTLPIAYKIGYNKGVLGNASSKSVLEKIADNQFSINNPEDHKDYVIDFNNRTVMPYSHTSENKIPEGLFSK